MGNSGLTHLTSDANATLGAYIGMAMPVLLPEEEWDVSAEATTVKRKWVVEMTKVRSGSGVPNYSVFPAIDEPCPSQSWLAVKSYRVTQKGGNGRLAVVEQVCEKVDAAPLPDPGDPDATPIDPDLPGGSVNPDQVPDDVTILQGSTQTVDIRRHPLFTTPNATSWGSNRMIDFWDMELGEFSFQFKDLTNAANANAQADLEGLTHYLVPGLTVRQRTFSLSEPSAATFFASLGSLSIPPGIGASGANNWLIVTGAREQINGVWMLEYVYLYSGKAWPSWLNGSF
jgi:hypothetical protein